MRPYTDILNYYLLTSILSIMKVKITARHFRAKDSLQAYVNEKADILNKYHEDILFTDVILSYDKPQVDTKYCEIVLKLRDKKITAKEKGSDFEQAVDNALSKVEIQLYKHKDKIKRQKHNNNKEIYKLK